MSAAPSDGGLILAAEGRSDYAISIPADPHPAVAYAAEELGRFFAQATRADLPVLRREPSADRPLFVLGRANPLTQRLAPGIPYSRLGDDGFVIRTAGRHVIIAGATPRGTLYGVYWFLRERLGCRWYADDTTVVPRHNKLKIPPLNETHVPRFRYRECFWPEGGEDGDFAARMMLNGQLGHRTVTRPLKEKHGGAVYSIGIFNVGTGPCLSPETRRRAIEAARKKLGRFPRDKLIYARIGHFDGGVYYTGGEDGRMIRAGGSPAAPLMALTAWLADQLRDAFPGAVFLGSAYLFSRKPCTNVRFPDNAGVDFAPIEADWSRPFDAPENRAILDDLDGWCRQTKHIWVWLYATNYGGYLQPVPDIYPMARTLRVLAQRPQVEGIFLEGAYHTPGSHLAALKAWLFARLLWDPFVDPEPLVDEFLRGYYGPAAPMMAEYIRLLHKSAAEHPSAVLTKAPPTLPYLNAKFLIRADQLMRQAEEATRGQPLYHRHVQITRMGVDWVMLLNGAALRAQAEAQGIRWPDDPDRLERFKRTVKLAGVKAFGESTGSVEDMLAALVVPRKLAPPPAPCRGLPRERWVEAQDLAFQLCDATIVPDPKASDGAAARLPGDTDVWGIQYPLQMLLPEEGEWEIYAAVRIDRGEGQADDLAMLLGISPGPHIELKVRELADEHYHVIKLPGGPYRYNAEQSLWAAPPNSRAVRFVYVDRVFAVRVR